MTDTQDQPVIESRTKGALTVDGLTFKDLDGDGQLAPYEDWRLSPRERAADLLTRMSSDEKTGLIRKMIAAHDVGKAINPLSCEGQIEGGVVMSMGYALTEQYPIDENCRPTARFGTLGLFRAHQVPEIKAIVIDKPGLNVACGAIGIGEITSIPTAPAIADAYYRLDGQRRLTLPLENTPYARKK